MSESGFEGAIREYAQKEDDIRLAEMLHEYFRQTEKLEYLPLKKLKSFFVAARTKDSETWKSLSSKQVKAIDNVLTWTNCSPNTLAVVLRTYERATPELRQAQKDGRLGRYAAESIGRLDKPAWKSLQSRVLDMYQKYGMTNEKLKKLVHDLQRALTVEEQESVLHSYTPPAPTREIPSFALEDPSVTEVAEDETVYVFQGMQTRELQQMSDDELWKLKNSTETALSQAVPLLKRSLEYIRQELRNRLS